MKAKQTSLVVSLVIALVTFNLAQDSKFSELADFTKSPTEHQIVIVDRPFQVRTVKGTIDFQNKPGEHLGQVLFEVESPGTNRVVRRAITNKGGKFKIPHVPEGIYKFKTTRDGFNSAVGKIVVSNRAPKGEGIRIALAIGY